MHTRAYFRSVILSLCLTSIAVLAQQSEPSAAKPAERLPAVRQAAMNLVEEALAGTGSLSLPANRLAIELRAFPIIWTRSETRARALVQQMAGEFAQAANASKQDPDQNPQAVFNTLRIQRNGIARAISGSDAELALLFVSTTQPYLDDDDPEDHALITELAAQIALQDPHRALQLAEQQLKESGELPKSMINLLDQVRRNDAQAGGQLLRDIVDHLKQQNLVEDTEALSFAASLLGDQFAHQSEAGQPDSTLRALAETVIAAVLGSGVAEQPFVLNDALNALDALVPSKAAALHSRSTGGVQGISVQAAFWQKFNQARSNGDANQTLAALSQAPENLRAQVSEQAAWGFANSGDLEGARTIAARLEPWQRNNVMQQAIRCAALAAGSRADFTTARQLAAQITDEDSRATLLADLAIFANGTGKTHLAEEMLGEAASLVANRSAGSSAFAAQLRVAQAYLRVKPAQAVPLLERSANQIEQALSAAAQLDGFLPSRPSFEGSELILNQGFLYNTLLEPYALAAAELASLDLTAARALANRLPLPEARLMTEIFVAAGVLDQKDQTQAASTSANGMVRFMDVVY